MALVRVAQYNSTPTVVEDYQAQNAHLQAFTNQLLTQQFILDSGTGQPVIKQGAYVSHGGSLYVADADTSITGSPADGSVYIRVSGTTTLTVEFINDISGYAWNPVYTALTSSSYTLLPYLIVKASTVWTRYNFNPNGQAFGSLASLAVTGNATVGGTLGVTGAINGAEITAQNKAVLRGRDMTYGFISNAKIVLPSQIESQALAIQDDGLYSYELADGIVYRRNPNFGSVVDSLDLQGTYGMTWIDGKLITCSLSTVYVYNGYSTSLITSFAAPDANRCGALGVKNGNLLTISYGIKRIYVHDGVSATVVDEINLANINSAYSYANLSGVVWTGENFIISLGGQSGVGPGQLVAISKNNDDAYDIENVRYISTTDRICGLTKRPDSNRLFFTSYSSSEASSNIMDILVGIK